MERKIIKPKNIKLINNNIILIILNSFILSVWILDFLFEFFVRYISLNLLKLSIEKYERLSETQIALQINFPLNIYLLQY